MADDPKYPKSSPGIAKMLHIDSDNIERPAPDVDQDPDPQESNFAERTAPAPFDLPIAVEPVAPTETTVPQPPQQPASAPLPITLKPLQQDQVIAQEELQPLDENEPGSSNRFWNLFKTIVPYVVIFGICLGLYFFYFSDFSFQSLFKSDSLNIESVSDVSNENLEQLKKDVAADYKIWLGQFFTDVTDESIISMDADVSGNGLTNLEKYLLNLNPKVYSTRGSVGDGQSVIEGVNPWTGKPFTDKQKQLIEKYINPELISNRITAAAITRGVTKYAQYVNPDSPYYIDEATLSQVGDGSTAVVTPTQITPSADGNTNTSTGNTGSQPAPTNLNPDSVIDQSKPGLLEIPSSNISVPLIWTQDTKDFDNDLKRGVVHYPGTAMPGDVGTSYISGHSSGYVWDKSPYKYVFTKLGSVPDGTSFTITATQKNGKTVKFNYVIERRAEFAANDQAQFISTADSVVALSTCWPVGTVDRRLVLFAKLTQTERN